MEIHWRNREKGPVVAAVIALVVLGLGSIFLTWQSIKRQRMVVENHMVLSAQVIIRGVEANLMRIMRSIRGNPAMHEMFSNLSQELFSELTASGEVVFVGLYDTEGHMLIGTVGEDEKPLGLPPSALSSLKMQGLWNGMTLFNGAQTMVVGLRARPPMNMLCDLDMGAQCEPNTHDAPVFVVTGLSAERHLVQFNQYRRAALFQTGYVFLAAMLLWFLAFAYQRRRDQGHRLGRMERFQSKLLDTMPDGLVTLGPDGEILAANGSALELLCPLGVQGGKGGPGLVGRQWTDLEFPELTPGAWEQVEHQGRRLEILAVPFAEFEGPAGDDQEVFEERLVLIRDRTKLRSLEEDLEEARRLATVGSLAAGVAHEVRNPLSSLRGFAQFFADKFKDKEPFGSYATTMVQEADRLNRVVTDLLFLARPRAYAMDFLDLAALLGSLRGLLRFDLEHKGIDLESDLAEPRVYADPDALRQVLLNLLANSLYAVEDKEGAVRLLSYRDKGGGRPGVWLAVEDNGPGMPEEVKRQAFEPFFTAKPQGTGLGLAIVQAIMRGHRGAVRIDSAPGRGTSVKLFFPDPAPERPLNAPEHEPDNEPQPQEDTA